MTGICIFTLLTMEATDFFLPLTKKHTLLGDTGAEVCPKITTAINKGILKEDNKWFAYRRNYFQLSCKISLLSRSGPGSSKLLIDGTDQVTEFRLAISAVYENGDDACLVQYTPLRFKGPKLIPGPIRLPLTRGSVVVVYERLQFQYATPNNSSRIKQKKPCFLTIQLLANSTDGRSRCVAETRSCPLIVRGRSPCHFTSRKPRSEDPSPSCFRHSAPRASLLPWLTPDQPR
ncbi:hypothetical protein DSO57_1038236 [Entomophthora muscae]|uniref:Uncharacterized protein n=1 Tax=Entomophthora muscae TaxID=34485 RepID=A0ACC2TKT2_9FUNG|nr:hypothetical protein DSO57_1038236 [Entomophthora muscae]